MAEIVGLVIGGVSLATVFSAALGLCECVRFGKSFGEDYETSLTKLSILRLRLSRWATAIQDQDQDLNLTTPEEGQQALRILDRIRYLFEETQKISLKYSGDIALLDPVIDTRYDTRRLVTTVGAIIKKRQKRTGIIRRTMWAVYDKEVFKGLLDDVATMVDNLVDLFPPERAQGFTHAQEALCESDLDILAQSKVPPMKVLADASGGIDDALAARIEIRFTVSPKHVFMDNEVSGQAIVKFGDEYLNGHHPTTDIRGNIYKNNKVYGEAQVHYGDTYGGGGSSFLTTAIVGEYHRMRGVYASRGIGHRLEESESVQSTCPWSSI